MVRDMSDISRLSELWHINKDVAFEQADANLAAWKAIKSTPCDADTQAIADRINEQRKASK